MSVSVPQRYASSSTTHARLIALHIGTDRLAAEAAAVSRQCRKMLTCAVRSRAAQQRPAQLPARIRR
jgi:hypothetical protein